MALPFHIYNACKSSLMIPKSIINAIHELIIVFFSEGLYNLPIPNLQPFLFLAYNVIIP